jgi:hypothetical protein
VSAELIQVLAMAGGFLLLLSVVGWVAERWMDAPVAIQARQDQRLPAVERQLLGDDWRDPIRPYFRRRFEDRTRVRLAIAATCGADPYPPNKGEGRAATTADPQDTRKEVSSCHEAA